MKMYCDTSVKPQQFEEGKEVLMFDPRKKRGHYPKWQVSWKGPMIIKRHLNNTNCVAEIG